MQWVCWHINMLVWVHYTISPYRQCILCYAYVEIKSICIRYFYVVVIKQHHQNSIYKKGLFVACSFKEMKPITIMVGSMENAGRQGTGTEAKSSYSYLQTGNKESTRQWEVLFEIWKNIPSDTPPPKGPYLQIFS